MNFLDKLIRHNRDDEGDFGSRVVLHVPVGFVIGLFFPLSYPLLKLLESYESNEDSHTSDEAWKDYFGAMVGVTLGMATMVIVLLILFFRG